MKFYIDPPTVNNPDLTPLLNVEGPIEVYDVWEVFREDIIKLLRYLPNEVTYHTSDANLKNDKLTPADGGSGLEIDNVCNDHNIKESFSKMSDCLNCSNYQTEACPNSEKSAPGMLCFSWSSN